MKLHEFLQDDVSVTIINEAEYRRKYSYREYDSEGYELKCDFDRITDGMDGQIVYYYWYAGGLAERVGFLSLDVDGNITEDRLVGMS